MSPTPGFIDHLAPATSWLSRQPWWVLLPLGLGTLLGLIALFVGWLYFYNTRLHHLANVPGGQAENWLLGDFGKMMVTPTGQYFDAKLKRFGSTYRGHQILAEPMIVTNDHTAIAFIQQNTDYKFIKPPTEMEALSRFIGIGLILAEYGQHARQRKVLKSSFSMGAIREMMPFLYQKTYELRDILAEQVEGHDVGAKRQGLPPLHPADVVPGARKIDMALWLNKVAFDMIGLAGFDINYECLTRGNEVVDLYRVALAELMRMTPINILQHLMPDHFNWIPSARNRHLDNSHNATQKVGRKLIASKKAEIQALQGEAKVEKDTYIGKDFLSLIVKANMAADLPANQRLTDQELVDQVSTFLLAGSETTSNSVGWLLLRLAENPRYQDRLREELFTIQEDDPSLDTLNSLPFLEACVREGLRVDTPVPETTRMVTGPVVMPLGTPVIGEDGKEITSIALKKGDLIIPSLTNVNRDVTVWGDDAREFNPDRFERPELPLRAFPGIYANTATFMGGPRHCIGYRFSLAEIKVLVFVLLRTFTFDTLPSNPEITQKDFIVMLPWVVGEEKYGSQLPLLLRLLEGEIKGFRGVAVGGA